MADFVGLLKKTIESQSQRTPQLRQRIYERARATVERKLAESEAPAPVVERQRDILNRAIDEVESYYREVEALARFPKSVTRLADRTQPLVEHEGSQYEEKDEADENETAIEAQESALSPMPAAPPDPEPKQEIVSDLTTPPPFEEAFAREEAQALPRSDDAPPPSDDPFPSAILAAGSEAEDKPIQEPQEPQESREQRESLTSFSSAVPDGREPASSFEPVAIADSPQSATEPPHSDETEIFKAGIVKAGVLGEKTLETEIPSIASLLGDKTHTPITPPPLPDLPPLDLPFLTADNLPESEGLENIPLVGAVTTQSATEQAGTEQTSTEQEAQADDAPPQDQIQDGIKDEIKPENLPENEPSIFPIVAREDAAREDSYSFADELLARLPLDDAPEPDAQKPAEGENALEKHSPLLEDYLPHWSTEKREEIHGGEIHGATSVESEIDRARREIEALRTDVAPQEERPFSPFDMFPLPVDEVDEPATATGDTGRPASSEADFNNDLVSEIFVQAAKREQHQSNKKRRIAAYLIGTIVLVVLAAIGGVLVFTNQYNFGGEQDIIAQTQGSQTQGQASSANNDATGEGNAAGTVAAVDTSNGDNSAQKITRRLLPDGEETDPGPALDNATPGEGISQAAASLPLVDNSARAVFYEAPTDILSATASEGRVEWSLRRSPAVTQSPDDASSAQEPPETLAIVGDIKIPALDMTLRLTLRRNHDDTVPADYLTEIIFVLPDDFDGEAIDEIGPILFKASEQSTGQELAGTVTAKVRDNLFLMAVRAPRPILDRNLALMRQLPWLKLNVLYKNGRVGEFSIAKGEGGNRIFQQAIDEWSRTATIDASPATLPSQEPSSPQEENVESEAANDGDVPATPPPSAASDAQN